MTPWRVAFAAAAVCGTALALLVACAWPANAQTTPDPVTGWAVAPSVALMAGVVVLGLMWAGLAVARMLRDSFRWARATWSWAEDFAARRRQP